MVAVVAVNRIDIRHFGSFSHALQKARSELAPKRAPVDRAGRVREDDRGPARATVASVRLSRNSVDTAGRRRHQLLDRKAGRLHRRRQRLAE
jgi:hypothetical protein